MLKCLVKIGSRLRFNLSMEQKTNGIKCEHNLVIRPKDEGSIIFEKETIDSKNIIEYFKIFNYSDFYLQLQFFKGFDLNLIDNDIDIYSNEFDIYFSYHLVCCDFNFYFEDKKMNSCQDFIKAANSTNPRSIFQMFKDIYD